MQVGEGAAGPGVWTAVVCEEGEMQRVGDRVTASTGICPQH